jgi:hypothetical protein
MSKVLNRSILKQPIEFTENHHVPAGSFLFGLKKITNPATPEFCETLVLDARAASGSAVRQ